MAILGITMALGMTMPVIFTRTNWPGSRAPSRLGKMARVRMVPVRGSTVRERVSTVPVCG